MVRRYVAVAALVLVSACSLRDAFSGHQDVVATAAGQELTVERVATMIAPAKSVPLRREIVDKVADLWVDYQLLAQAVAQGDSLTDSATALAASWPVVMQALATGYHDSVVARAHPSPAQVDSAYNGNDFRYVSHILVMARQDTTAAVKAAKRRLAQGFLDQVHHGADFAQLASRVSEDPGSKANGGNLGLVGRGVMVKPFEDAAFALRPGEMSATLVETAFGYHILYRPNLAQIRDSFTTLLTDVFAGRADSLFLDSLTNKTGIAVRSRAPQIARAAAQNLRAAKTRSRTLATWRGGELTEKQFATWLQAHPPQTAGLVAQAPDSTLNDFVKSIARNEMIVDAARRRHISLTPTQRDSIRGRYRTELEAMLTGMGIAPESLAADSTIRGAAKTAVAARHVDAYFTSITNNPGQRQYFAVPPFLADVLRSRAAWKVNAAGVDRALERAKVLRGPEAPDRGGPGMTPAPGMQRAPGGPPVGGRAPAPTPRRPN